VLLAWFVLEIVIVIVVVIVIVMLCGRDVIVIAVVM
jgi:hypothetical protein